MTDRFSRVPDNRWSEPIDAVLSWLSPSLQELLGGVRWLCGVDPVFAGLHAYEDTVDGRSYRGTAHCVYPEHQRGHAARRITTIVLPVPDGCGTIIHELGHVLDQRLGFAHETLPVDDYARTDRRESFAQAFTTWVYLTDRGLTASDKILLTDRPTLALFEMLSAATP